MADTRARRSPLVWLLSIALAAIFLTAGISKLIGSEPFFLQAAAMRGFPGWIRVVVGIVEVAGAIALLIPALAPAAALLLALLMVPATITQIVSGEPGAYIPAILFVFLLLTAYLRATEEFRAGWRALRETPHPLLREGAIAGILGATAIAVWFLFVDLISGRPLYTPTTLGRALFAVLGPVPEGESQFLHILAYTIFHYAAFIVVGILAAAIVRAAAREPSVLLGFVILFVAFEIGFHALVALLQETTDLGALAWYNIMAGNLIAAAIMGTYLYRTNPALKHTFTHAIDGPGE
ncbi:MAG TPA: DoxX family protein [Gemmatimonadaceae bacterium]|jgi:putative oxidoreductase|nr:DoxX family protein [Gemmatimonadaceae bacterium]